MSLRSRIVIILFLALAFGLRSWGLAFGLPYEFHPDEHKYVDAVLTWYTGGELRLEFVNPPLFTYVLVAGYGLWFLLSPFMPSPDWITGAYFFARWWSLAFGLLTVALAYPLGRRLYDRKVGFISLIWLAGLFLPAREAHFAVNDTAATFFTLLTLYFSLVLLQKRSLSPYLWAGAAAGLAAASKLTAGLVILAPILAHGLASSGEAGPALRRWLQAGRQRPFWLCLAIAGATYALVSAHIFWQFPAFVKDMVEHLQFGTEGYKGLKMSPGSGWYFYGKVLGWGMGWPLLLASLFGIGQVMGRRYRPGLLLALFPLFLFIYMGAQKILFARFLLPAVPPLVGLAALGLVWLEERWSLFGRYRKVIYPMLVGGLLAPSLLYLAWFDHLLTLPDTRQRATAWLLENLPEDSVVTKESYSLLPGTFFLPGASWPYKVIQLDERGPNRNNPDYYLSHKTEIIAPSNFTFARVRQNPQEEVARLAQLAALEEKAILLKTFSPYRRPDYDDWFYLDQLYGPAGETLQRLSPGPLIKIYRLPYESQPYTLALPVIPTPIEANFGGKLTLLGYDLPKRRAMAGEAFPLTLYWRAETAMAEDYVIFNRLLDGQQHPWGGYDRWPQETAKTSLWHPQEIVVDSFNLPVAAKAPPGIYTIDIGLYDQADPGATPLPLWQEDRPLDQNSIRLGPVKVGGAPPEMLFAPSAVHPQRPLAVEWGEPPVILGRGYDLSWSEEALHLKLYWECLTQTAVDWSIFVHLRNSREEMIAQKDGPAGGGNYPTSLWDPGEIIRDTIVVPLPDGGLKEGDKLVIGLYEVGSGQRLPVPGWSAHEVTLDIGDE